MARMSWIPSAHRVAPVRMQKGKIPESLLSFPILHAPSQSSFKRQTAVFRPLTAITSFTHISSRTKAMIKMIIFSSYPHPSCHLMECTRSRKMNFPRCRPSLHLQSFPLNRLTQTSTLRKSSSAGLATPNLLLLPHLFVRSATIIRV